MPSISYQSCPTKNQTQNQFLITNSKNQKLSLSKFQKYPRLNSSILTKYSQSNQLKFQIHIIRKYLKKFLY